jgi:hypothetical protein
MATILSMIQDVCRRNGLSVPSAIQGSQDAQNVQYIGVVNECLEDMRQRFTWQATTLQAIFTTTAGESQGYMHDLAPYGFDYMINETLFNRTLRLPLFGPLSEAEWQAQKAIQVTGPNYQFRIRGRELLFLPDAVAGHTCAFEYASNWPVVDPSGDLKEFYTNDDDIIILSEACFKACFEWSWKAKKGLDYAEDFRRYEAFVVDTKSSDTAPRRVNAANPTRRLEPGIWVPAGNWMQP